LERESACVCSTSSRLCSKILQVQGFSMNMREAGYPSKPRHTENRRVKKENMRLEKEE
jgi:hypothetical protein